MEIILSIFKVNSKVKLTSNPKHRWHYYVKGENLTRFYGEEWNKHYIHISDEKNHFVQNSKYNVTPSGKNSYGTLQRGGDKLKITKEFGDYLIGKIVEINKQIAFKDDNI